MRLSRLRDAAWAAGVAAMLALPRPAMAHGGTVEVLTRSGPYGVAVFTTPRLFPAGAVDVSAAITDEARRRPADGLSVTIKAQEVGGGRAISQLARRQQFGADDDYTATLDLPLTGMWRIAVVISGASGVGQAAFTYDAWHAGLAGTLGDWLLWAAPVLVALRLGFCWLQTKRRAPHTPAAL
jgi:hypothetical protein